MAAINLKRIRSGGYRWLRPCLLALLLAVLDVGKLFPACSPFIEESADHLSATFRAHTSAFDECPVSEATYRQVVATWLASREPGLPQPRLLGLGRAISFPWISHFFVETAREMSRWQKTVATRPRREWDATAAKIILAPELRARLAAPFARSQLRVGELVFEKILYGPEEEHGARGTGTHQRVPFDAQLWLRLHPNH